MAGAGLSAGSLIAAEVPRKAPEFVVDLPGGQKIALSGYRGKALLFGFVLTT